MNQAEDLRRRFSAIWKENEKPSPRINLAARDGDGHGKDMEARVAKLEALAENTKDSLKDLRSDLRDLRSDIKDLRKDGLSAVKWLLGLGATATIAIGGLVLRILMTMPNH